MDKLETLLSEFLAELKQILGEVKAASPEVTKPVEEFGYDGQAFFKSIRKSLFGKLTSSQVEGIEAKIKAFKEAGWPVSWAAYALATSYHETAGKMVPVREGLNASEAWRKKTLRYYPWYGRGDGIS